MVVSGGFMLKIIFLSLCFLIFAADNVYAYIDYGTGSFVLQILTASAIGLLFFLKRYMQKIKQFFQKKTPPLDDADQGSKESE